MRRVAIIFTVISGLLLILGLADSLANYNPNPGIIFGNPNVGVSAGVTVLIGGGVLILVSAVMWIMALRKGQSDQRES